MHVLGLASCAPLGAGEICTLVTHSLAVCVVLFLNVSAKQTRIVSGSVLHS